MSNPYFTHVSKYTPGTLAKGNEVDADFTSVNVGFDDIYVDIKRAIKMPTSITDDQVLPELVADRANQFIGFDSAGDLTVGTPTSITSPVLGPSNAYQIARVDSVGAAWEFEDGLIHSPTNVLFAPGAGGSLTGADNTLIGPGAGAALTTGTGNILIGHDAGATLTTESDVLVIYNTSSAAPLIYGDMSADRLGINRAPTAWDFEVNGSAQIFGGSLWLGSGDNTRGTLKLFGAATGQTLGGYIDIYSAADHDTTLDYMRIAAYNGDVVMWPDDLSWTHTFRNDGSVEFAGRATINDTTVDSDKIEINSTGTGDRNAYIDFHSDDTYTDYGLRIICGAGANTASYLHHRGTGELSLRTQEAASISFYTTGTYRGGITSSGALNWAQGSVSVGSNDITQGLISIYGDSGTNGGELRLYNGATNDTTVDYWSILANDQLEFLAAGSRCGYVDNLGQLIWEIGNAEFQGGGVRIGTDDTTKGALYLYGDSTTNGGAIRLYNGASEDTSIDYLTIEAATENTVSIDNPTAYTNLAIGADDVRYGLLTLYGNATTTGGAIRLYNGASADTTVDYWSLNSGASGNLNINTNSATMGYINTSGALIWSQGTVTIGVDDTTQGALTLYGDSSFNGGLINLYNGATQDTTDEYWSISAFYGSLVIHDGSPSSTPVINIHPDHSIILDNATGGSAGAGTINLDGGYYQSGNPVFGSVYTSTSVSSGTTYQNSVGRPIIITWTGYATSAPIYVYVGTASPPTTVAIYQSSHVGTASSKTFIVPDGYYWRITGGGTLVTQSCYWM